MESILLTMKKMLGDSIPDSYFDTDIIIHINSVFMTLTQLGVGPAEGFIIEDDTAVWTDFLPDPLRMAAAKSYMYIKLRLLFDPPTGAALLDAYKEQAKELEWRLNADAESEELIQNG